MTYMWILLALSLAVSSVGWFYFIYFFSIGYGFTISVLSVATAIIFRDVITLPIALLCAVLFIYGIRLGLYLLIREKKSEAYKKTFYLYNMAEGLPVNDAWAWAGTIIATLGIVIEAIADAHKSKSKKVNPGRYVDTGLYRIVRCPNYFGEILMWTGTFIICFGACCNVWQWVIASLGYICIVYVMFSGARRLEMRQEETYGKDVAFKEYTAKTPLIIPFVPIYSVAKYKWLQA